MILCVVVALLLGGCTPAYHPHIHLDESVDRPETAVLLISVDGMSEQVMDEMLEADELPNIARLIENGVRVGRAVCSLPSITYSSFSTILTGCSPGRHGITGNKWFDRYSLIHRDYGSTRTYRDVDNDIMVPTVYEHLGDELTVSIQCAVRRGVTRAIDNWASSGLRWFVGSYEATDQLIPLRFDLIAEEANRRGCWPVLIHAYFPATDEIGHRHGSNSPQYRRGLQNVDRQIGLIRQALAGAGMSDRTCTILLADHNHTPVPPGQWFDVAHWLRNTVGLCVRTTAAGGRSLADRERAYRYVDAVVLVGGDRIARIYLQGPGGWHEQPTQRQIAAVLSTEALRLCDHEAIDFIAVPGKTDDGQRVVDLYARRGRSEIERCRTDSGCRYRYTVAECGALDFGPNADTSAIESVEWRDAATWLALTADSSYPGVIEQLADLFDSPRGGDIVLFAAEGWDFTPGNYGGHGGARACDTRVPLIFSGPMLDRSAVIEAARLADVTPTILGLLGKLPVEETFVFDGADWSGILRGVPLADQYRDRKRPIQVEPLPYGRGTDWEAAPGIIRD
ncbi:MAG: alkaline phosphatase family protein [Phycisphaerae bacterium]|nr:alkaline phosphatase family protein [Phycisphaerae bacterium]